MLGTYFFTVSSLSLSHTPSSLWIYRENKQQKSRAVPSRYYGNRVGSALTHAHTHINTVHTHMNTSEAAGKAQVELEDGGLTSQQGAGEKCHQCCY